MQKTRKWLQTIVSILKYPSIIKKINKSKTSVYCFFPVYHIGGAERVHLDILNVVKDQNPVCFITEQSTSNDFKNEFSKNAILIELFRWSKKTSFKKHIAKKIASKINNTPNAVVFGCNSHLFYYLLPFLSPNVKKIDLIHYFIGDHSFEEISLPLVPLLDNRVVLGPKHLEQLTSYYVQKNVDRKYAERIKIVSNQVEIPSIPADKNFKNDLRILFIARNAPEKRVPVFLEIARRSEELNLPYKFAMIGDFENYQHLSTKNIQFISRITDKLLLNIEYAKSHFVMLTSSFEGFPMVLLEGMALGNIPIITNVGEVAGKINETTNTGFIIENYSEEESLVKDFIDKLKFIANHRELLPIISQNSIEIVKNDFNYELFKKNYRNLLLADIPNAQ